MAIPRINTIYVQDILNDRHITTNMKAKIIREHDMKLRDLESRGTDRSLPYWRPADIDSLAAEIDRYEVGHAEV